MAGTLNVTTISGASTITGVSTLNAASGVLATQNGMTGIAKAWVNFNGTGTVAINNSFNVSSITDNGTGDYTVNFTTAMPNAFFVTQLTGNNSGARSNTYGYTTAQTTSSVAIKFADDQSTLTDVSSANVAIFSS
jgi:hypothetical protein